MRVTLIGHREEQAACPRSQSSKAPVLLRAETQGHLTPSQSGNEVSCPPWCGRVTRDICSRLSSTWHLWSQHPIFLGDSLGGLTPCLVPASDPDLANDSPVALTTVTSSGESRVPHEANQTLEFCRNDLVREACFPVGCEGLALPDPMSKKENRHRVLARPRARGQDLLSLTEEGC